jgi:hypothetical protein
MNGGLMKINDIIIEYNLRAKDKINKSLFLFIYI